MSVDLSDQDDLSSSVSAESKQDSPEKINVKKMNINK